MWKATTIILIALMQASLVFSQTTQPAQRTSAASKSDEVDLAAKAIQSPECQAIIAAADPTMKQLRELSERLALPLSEKEYDDSLKRIGDTFIPFVSSRDVKRANQIDDKAVKVLLDAMMKQI